MENVFLTSLTTPEVRQLFKEELHSFFNENSAPQAESINTGPPITTKQLCEYLNITEPTVIRWRAKGKIPFMRIGNAYRYDISAVTAALSNKKA